MLGVRYAVCIVAALLSPPLLAALIEPPSILQPPQSVELIEGQPASLSVVASGENLSFQWRLNGVNLPGANQATLNIPIFQVPNGGRYDVIVWNEGGAVISTPAGVTVTLAGLPAVDLFSDRLIPPLPSPAVGRGAGNNLTATQDANEPRHAGKPGGRSVWYSWLAPASGIVKFSTAGSDFDTVLAVYTGTNLATLSSTLVAADDDSGGFHTSELMFNAQAGTTYFLAIDSHNGRGGNFVLSWNLEIPLDLGDRLPVITRKPTSVVELQGKPAKLSLDYLTTGTEQVQWFFKDEPITGTPFELLISDLQPTNVGPYRVQVQKGNRMLRTEPVDVQINIKDNATLKNIFAYNKFAETFFVEKQNGTLTTSGFTTLSAGTSRGYSGTQVFSTYGATTDPEEPLICGYPGGSSEWYAYKAEQTGLIKIDTDGSNYDTVLGVYVDNGSGAGFYESLQQVACDDNSGLDRQDSMVLFAATKGVTYYIAVDGKYGASGTAILHYYLGLPPTFLLQPTNQVVAAGGTAEFNSEIEGSGPLSYQWRFGRFNIPDATSPYYARTNIDMSHSGTYVLTVWNPVGTNRSDSAFLTVAGPPYISEIQDVTLPEDSGPGMVEFGLSDTDTSLSDIVLLVTAEDPMLFSNLSIGGSTGARTLLYTPAPDANGTTLLTVSASDGISTYSRSFQITLSAINDPPSADSQALQIAEDSGELPVALSGTDPENSLLSFQVIDPPVRGVLTGSPPNVSYRPNPNANGTDSFTYRVSDGALESAAATVSINITPVNDPPLAFEQSIDLDEDTSRVILLSASDLEGSPLAFSVLTSPTKGTLTGTPPNLTYTPNPNANGTDSFTFKANDGELDSALGTISLAVTSVNDVPTALSQSVTLDEDAPKEILLSGSDIEGSPLAFTVVEPPSHGTLTGAPPNLTYIPNPDANGPDTFTFKVNDGELDSAPATVTINISPINDQPLASAQAITLDEDTTKTILLTGTDPEGTALIFTVVTPPAKGTLSGTPPVLTYTPNLNATGPDSFSFKVSDASLDSTPATVNLTITAINDPPVAVTQTVTLNEDTTKAVLLTASDPEGTALTFSILTQPTKGTLTGTPPNLTYTPNLNSIGADSFTFKANDGSLDSAAATIHLTINPVNDAPVALAQSVTLDEDTPKTLLLTGTDPEGTALSFSILTQPTRGTLTGTLPNLTYTPNSNANGSDSFTFKASDGSIDSAPATVTLTISPVNDAPVALAQSLTLDEDTPITLLLTGTDPEGTALSFSILTQPAKGSLTGTLPNLTYTPNSNSNGSDSFTFKASDGSLDSAPVTVSITISSVNDAPVALGQSVTLAEDTSKPILLTGTDPEGTALSFSILTQPAKGSLTGTLPNLTYTPNSNSNGSDSFTFKASDGSVDSAPTTITLTISPVNDAPVALAQSVTLIEDTSKPILLNGTDPEGTALTFSILTQPTRGTLTGTPPNLTYTPNSNSNGSDSFTFKASDGEVDSSPATVTLTISSVNDAPVALAQSVTLAEDTSKPILLTGTDPEGTTLSFSILTQPTRGTLTGTPPNLTYTPNLNVSGPDSFTFKASDGSLDSAPATVSITISPVNDAPLALAQSVTLIEDTSKPILLNGTDLEEATLTFSIETQPSKGTLVGTPPNLTYTPHPNANGSDSFTFKVNDDELDSASATISLVISSVNDTPTALARSFTLDEDTSKAIVLTGSDIEDSVLTFTVVGAPSRGTLTGTPPNLTYTPGANVNGTDSFTFKVNDGEMDSSLATISLVITALNDPPVAQAQSIALPEDSSQTILLTGTDPEGTALSFSILTQPTRGTLTGTPPNLTYTPNLNVSGPDSFTFNASDGSLDSAPATVTLTISSVNDAPVALAQSVTLIEDTSKPILLNGTDLEEATLTFSIDTQPSKGTLVGTPPNLTYTPHPNANGSDSFTFKVNDGELDSASATISLVISSVNDTPTALARSFTLDEDTSKAIVLTGSDIEDSVLTFTVVGAPSRGTLTGTPPNLTYTPGANVNGTDSFTFKVNDGSLDSAPATVGINISPVNDAPVALAQAITLNEDTTTPILLSGTDPEGTTLTFSIVTQPAKGTLTGTPPNLAYTPNLNVSGPDSFTFEASDGSLDSAPATVGITISPVNDAPVALAQAITLTEDTTKPILLGGTDPESTTLTFSIVTQPAKGTLTGTPPNLTYTPNLNVSGPDSFTFEASDGSLDSAPATVSITISPVNDAPVALAQAITLDEDTTKAILLGGTDPEGTALSFSILTQPARGTLTGTPPNLAYTPHSNFHGSDSFTFKASDSSLDSAPATVSINISPVNDAPLALAQTVTLDEDTTTPILLSGEDPEGTPLSFFIVDQPSKGTLTGTPPNLIYTPNPAMSGSDSFTFQAGDGILLSAEASVSLRITGVNDPPVAEGESITLNEDTPLSILLTGSDTEGSTLNFVVLAPPAKGTLSGSPPTLTYTPNENATGTDSFTFKVSDGALDSAPATISLNISAVNDPPVALGQSLTLAEDSSKTLMLTGSDIEETALTFSIVTQPAKGTLTGTLPNLTYTPNSNFNGSDSFTFKASDGSLDSAPATVSITISSVNDAPVALAQSVTLAEDTSKPILLTGTDPEGTALSFSILTQPTRGTLTGTPPNLTYTPNSNSNGSDSFTFKASDGEVDSSPATVSITISSVNDAPVAPAQSVTLAEDTSKPILLTGTDPEGTALSFSILTQPTRGTLTGTLPNLTYTPNSNANGSDSFTFKASDGSLDSAPATVSITISPVNDAPVALAQSLTLTEDTSKPILLNGTDLEEATLTFSIETQPSKGTLVGTPPNLTYTPHPNANGSDSFTFKVNDGELDSASATISLVISSVNDTPTALARSFTLDEDTSKAIVLTGSDIEDSVLTFTVVGAPSRGTLTGTPPNLTYTPGANVNGTDSFTFKVNDGEMDSSLATISLVITALNDPPVAQAQSIALPEDSSQTILLTGTDPEGTALSFSILTQPTRGTLTGTPPNLTYTPNLNVSGPDSFTFKASDGEVDSSPATVTLTISSVNDAPVALAQSVTLIEDTSKPILLNGTDLEEATLTFSIDTQPSKGTLVGTPPNLTYTPHPNANGSDSFTFKVNDGELDSASATISLVISSVNDTPTALARSFTLDEDTSKAIVLTGSDIEDSVLTFTVVGAPSRGTLTGTPPNLTYTPGANVNGTDSFTFKVNDGSLDSAPATVSINISPVNDAPVALAQAITLNEDTTTPILLGGTDPEGTTLTFSIVTQPAKGTLTGTPPNLAYTPNLNVSGPDSFTFKVSDGSMDSAPATVSINISPVNDAPMALPQLLSELNVEPITILLAGTDPDADPLSFSIITPPHSGILQGELPTLTYIPSPGTHPESDFFEFTVSDGLLQAIPVRIDLAFITPVQVKVEQPSSGALKFELLGPSGLYLLECSEDLVNWIPANPQPVPAGTVVEERIQMSTAGKFYRIRHVDPPQ